MRQFILFFLPARLKFLFKYEYLNQRAVDQVDTNVKE